MKSIKAYISDLKGEHLELALRNYSEPYARGKQVVSHEAALLQAFDWKESPEGFNYWYDVWTDLVYLKYFDAPQHSQEGFESKARAYVWEATSKPTEEARPLPTDAEERKEFRIFSGFVNYFPHAIAAVSRLSYKGSLQHHPDEPMHWDTDKSTDELDALMRHMIDGDWEHVAWRALANLERKLTGKCQYEKGNI